MQLAGWPQNRAGRLCAVKCGERALQAPLCKSNARLAGLRNGTRNLPVRAAGALTCAVLRSLPGSCGTAGRPQTRQTCANGQVWNRPSCDEACCPLALQSSELALHRPAWWKLAHSSRTRSQDAVSCEELAAASLSEISARIACSAPSLKRCNLRAFRGLSDTLLVQKALRDKKAEPHFRNSHKPRAENANCEHQVGA